MINDGKILNQQQVAILCGVSSRTVGYWVKKGWLPPRPKGGWPESTVRDAKVIKRSLVCGLQRGEFGIEPSVLLAAERAKAFGAHHDRFSLNDVAWLQRRAAGDDDLMDDDFLLLYDVPEDMLDLMADRKGERLQQLLALRRGDGLVNY